MISLTLADPMKRWTEYYPEQSISYYCMLKQYNVETENAGQNIYHTHNLAITRFRLLQREPDFLNFYIIVLLPRKLCQSENPQNVYSTQELL